MKRERITVYVDDLYRADDYGVHGSTFWACLLCGQESGAGVLNKGVPHKDNCPLGRWEKRRSQSNDTFSEQK